MEPCRVCAFTSQVQQIHITCGSRFRCRTPRVPIDVTVVNPKGYHPERACRPCSPMHETQTYMHSPAFARCGLMVVERSTWFVPKYSVLCTDVFKQMMNIQVSPRLSGLSPADHTRVVPGRVHLLQLSWIPNGALTTRILVFSVFCPWSCDTHFSQIQSTTH